MRTSSRFDCMPVFSEKLRWLYILLFVTCIGCSVILISANCMSRLADWKMLKLLWCFIDLFCHDILVFNLVLKWWRYHIFSCQNDANLCELNVVLCCTNLELVVVLNLEFKALYYYFDIWSHLQHDLSFCFSLLILMSDEGLPNFELKLGWSMSLFWPLCLNILMSICFQRQLFNWRKQTIFCFCWNTTK